MAKPGKHLIVSCVICNKMYQQYRSDQLYCSGKCGSIAWRQRAYPYAHIKCKWCKEEFKRLHGRQVYCCKECQRKAEIKFKKVVGGKGKGWSKGMIKVARKKCIICSQEFYAAPVQMRRHKNGGSYCSNKCRTEDIAKRPERYPQTSHRRGRGGKRDDLEGRYFRSSWEANYARYLNVLIKHKQIISWEYEVDVFEFVGIKKGTRFYTPDFKIKHIDGSIEYHEVKGYMDSQSQTKLTRMKKYYPKVQVVLVDAPVYRRLAKRVSKIIPNWE